MPGKKTIFGSVAIIFLGLLIIPGGLASIGCEKIEEKNHCWNNGKIVGDTYFWIDKNGLQLANYEEAYNWLDYEAGFNYSNNAGEQRSIGLFDFNYSENVRTNNVSYWLATYSANFSIGNKGGNLTVRIGQLLNDSFVTYQVILETNSSPSWNYWNGSLTFWRRMRNINISLDNKNDFVQAEQANHTYRISLNRTSNLTDELLDGNYIKIYDNATGRAIEWGWPGMADYHASLIANPGRNADVLFWRKSAKIMANQSYTLNHYWIDDYYSLSPLGSRSGYIHYKPLASYTAYTDVNARIGKSINISGNEEDRGFYSFNITGVKQPGWNIYKVTFGHYVLNILTDSGLDNWVTRFYDNFTYGTLVGSSVDFNAGVLVDSEDWSGTPGSPQDVEIDLGQGAIDRINSGQAFDDVKIQDYSTYTGFPNYFHVTWKAKLYIYYTNPSINLSLPLDYTILNDSKNWQNFSCNWTESIPNNISLYINGSRNFTSTGTGNLTKNLSWVAGHYFDWTSWDCLVCSAGNCSWSDNGNFTFAFHNQTVLNISQPLNNTNTLNTSVWISCGATQWQPFYIAIFDNGELIYADYHINLSFLGNFTPGTHNITCMSWLTDFRGYYTNAYNNPVVLIIGSVSSQKPTYLGKTSPPLKAFIYILLVCLLFLVAIIELWNADKPEKEND